MYNFAYSLFFRFGFMMMLLLLSFGLSGQSTFYVSTTGADGNNGDINNPWLTIQYAIYQLNPGDTLQIRGGTYHEKIDLDVSGTAAQWITIKSYPGEEAIMDASTFNDDASIIWTDDAYLRIEGLHLTKNIFNFAAGLSLQGAAHHIDILNNKISEIKFSSNPSDTVSNTTNAVPLSIYADSATDSIHDITIRGNEVFNNRTGYSENISAGGNFTDFIIEANLVHDNTNIGIDIGGNYKTCSDPVLDHGRRGVIRNNIVYNCVAPYGPAAGIYIDGGHHIIVENNFCHHNGYGGEIGCEENGTTTGIVFRNNVFHHNGSAGMHIGGYDVNTTGVVTNSKIYNNTFYANDTNNYQHGELLLSKSIDCEIFNNIFFLSTQNVFLYAYRNQTNMIMNYNLIYNSNGSASGIETTTDGDNNDGNSYTGLTNFYNATGYGVNSMFGDPLFVNVSGDDFHINSGSPAINVGDPNHIPVGEVDMDGQERAVGQVDIGADEYNSVLAISDLNDFSGLSIDNGILLNWTLSTLKSTSSVAIQKFDFQKDEWNTIYTINDFDRTKYLDRSATIGNNIYRLSSIGKYGFASYSDKIIIFRTSTLSYWYPNPSHGALFFTGGKEDFIIYVRNMLGQVIRKLEWDEELVLDKGSYIISIVDMDGTLKNKSIVLVN